MKKLSAYFLILVVIQSCSEGGFFRTGEMITETRSFPEFTYVEIRDVFDVTLRQTDTPGVTISCGEALMPGIKTTFSNDTLIISNDNHFDWTRKYRRIELVIETDTLEKITLDEPCSFRTDGVYKQDKLIVWATNNLTEIDIEIETGHFYMVNSWINTGNYRVSGQTEYAYFVINGAANLDASGLDAEDMYVEQRSIDDLKIKVKGYLTYGIKNSGDIICYSQPETTERKFHTGTGELVFR